MAEWGLQDHLLDQGLEIGVEVTDRIYFQSFNHLRICNGIVIIFNLTKIATLPFFVVFTHLIELKVWFSLVFLISFVQLYVEYHLKRRSNQNGVYYVIAKKVGHWKSIRWCELPRRVISCEYRVLNIYDMNNPHAFQEDNKRMRVLSHQIKYEIQQSDLFVFMLSRVQFIIYQTLHCWGLVILCSTQEVDPSSKVYFTLLLTLTTYQYLEIYLTVMFAAFVLPLFTIIKIYNTTKLKLRLYRLARALRSEPLSSRIKGDLECKICLLAYEKNDQITVLKCSDLHHFHADCFKDWAKNALTCPLCRKKFIDL